MAVAVGLPSRCCRVRAGVLRTRLALSLGALAVLGCGSDARTAGATAEIPAASGGDPGAPSAEPASLSDEPTRRTEAPLEPSSPTSAPAPVPVEARYPGTSADDPALAIDALTAAGAVSTSLGGPNDGRLEGGVPLPFLALGLESNPRRPNATAYWGTLEMVRALVRAAAVVERDVPGSILVINDLGFREGGPIPHHGSHRAGRDVDILFYALDMDGEVRRALGVPIEPDGHGTDFGDLLDPADDVDLRIDVPRTWRLVQALVEDEEALVQRIFLVEHVRTMLLVHAEAIGAPRQAIDRFAAVTCQPGVPHDDHLHVRFFCTAEDLAAGCADSVPMYPWRRRQLREAGLEPVMATPRERAPSDTTSAAEAEAAAPPMHDAVRAFLDRREVWSERPHPGRPYCR